MNEFPVKSDLDQVCSFESDDHDPYNAEEGFGLGGLAFPFRGLVLVFSQSSVAQALRTFAMFLDISSANHR